MSSLCCECLEPNSLHVTITVNIIISRLACLKSNLDGLPIVS